MDCGARPWRSSTTARMAVRRCAEPTRPWSHAAPSRWHSGRLSRSAGGHRRSRLITTLPWKRSRRWGTIFGRRGSAHWVPPASRSRILQLARDATRSRTPRRPRRTQYRCAFLDDVLHALAHTWKGVTMRKDVEALLFDRVDDAGGHL